MMTLEQAAADAFEKAERVKMLELMNSPTDYEERKKAYIELAVARSDAEAAKRTLDAITNWEST